ncbi:MAG TPA: hypothetical protein VLH84_03430 [Patescibacteria group bacterium]|nr:hypothetical protein [Patescibacteria group bacterium]
MKLMSDKFLNFYVAASFVLILFLSGMSLYLLHAVHVADDDAVQAGNNTTADIDSKLDELQKTTQDAADNAQQAKDGTDVLREHL